MTKLQDHIDHIKATLSVANVIQRIKLKDKYQLAVNEYLDLFIEKQNIEFSGWVSNDIGGVACFIDEYFISFDDIRMDIDKNAKPGLILNWQDDTLENKPKKINYYSYIKGLRYENI